MLTSRNQAAFDWTDYVSLADALSKQTGEAELRAATSRAYYGAFCSARNKLGRAARRRRRSVHLWTWSQYQRSADPTRRQIGIEGDRLKRLRVQADYYDEVPDPSALATTAVQRANYILGLLASLP